MHRKIFNFIIKRKRFAAYTMLRLLATALGLIVNIFIVKKLSVYDYGTYSLAIMLVGLATTFSFSWSSSSILYFGSKEEAESNSINKTFWARNILLLISLIVVTAAFLIYRNWINNFARQSIAINILAWIYIQLIADFINQYYLTVQKQITASVMFLISKLMFLIAIVFLSFKSSLDIVNINILTDALMLVFIIKFDKKDIGKPVFDKLYFREILSFSLWQLFGFIGMYITNFGDNLVIKYFFNTEDIGIYNSAYKLFKAFADLSYLIVNFYGAYISEALKVHNFERLRNFYYKERYILWGLIVILHIIIIAACRPIIMLLYDNRYIGAVPILQVLLLGSIVKYFEVFYIPFCNATKEYKKLQILNIVEAIVNISLDILLVPKLGALGAAVATVIAVVVLGLSIIVMFERKIINIAKGGDGYVE